MAHATLRHEGSTPWESKQGYPPPHGIDGDPDTFWEPGQHDMTYGQRADQYYLVDMRFPQRLSRLVLDSSTCHPVDSNNANGQLATSMISAWVADAIRAKARARAELVADLEHLEQREPTSPEMAATMSRALRLPRATVVKALKAHTSRAGGRRAA